MEPPEPSFADEVNIRQEDTVLVCNVRPAEILLPFQIYHLQVLVKAGLIAFSNACFKFADEGAENAEDGTNLPKILASHVHGFSKIVAVEVCA